MIPTAWTTNFSEAPTDRFVLVRRFEAVTMPDIDPTDPPEGLCGCHIALASRTRSRPAESRQVQARR